MKASVTSLPKEIGYLRERPEALHLVRLFMKDKLFFEAWERAYLLLKRTSAEEISPEEAFLLTHSGALGIIRDIMNNNEKSEIYRLINSYGKLIER